MIQFQHKEGRESLASASTVVPSAPAASLVHLKKIEINQEGQYDKLNISFFLVTFNMPSGLGMRRRGREHLDLVQTKPHCYHHQIHRINAPTNPCSICYHKHQGVMGQSERIQAILSPPSTWSHAQMSRHARHT